ncbi:MAG: DUF1404 family protein [Hyphomicrobiaceae bacterium]|nr:DUF1404 family protein [Hyphomicrobiaceae bacterium]
MMRRYGAALATVLLVIAVVPPLSAWWEASLVRHLLLQVPMLVLAGLIFGSLLARRSRFLPGSGQMEGVAAVLLAAFCLAFWMLPRWLDAAVADPRVDAAKAGSLVLLAGLPLGWGWSRLRPVARAFIWANAVSMLAAMGVLYLTFPDRLCNNYLASEQPELGRALLGLALVLGLAGAARAMLDGRTRPGDPLAGGH